MGANLYFALTNLPAALERAANRLMTSEIVLPTDGATDSDATRWCDLLPLFLPQSDPIAARFICRVRNARDFPRTRADASTDGRWYTSDIRNTVFHCVFFNQSNQARGG